MKLLTRNLFILAILLLVGCSKQQTVPLPTSTPKPTKIVFLPTITPIPTLAPVKTKIHLPPKGYLYQGVYPGGRSGEEDDITLKDLMSYEESVGKDAAWVYFSNNWYRSREFPTQTAEWIRNAGSIPFIRLMLRPDLKHDGNGSDYSVQNIINGDFDNDLQAWCTKAREFGTHILAEYGTEVNSDSFVWSGISNGAGKMDGYGDPAQPDGPERFRDAYRHIIQTCRDEGASNITWVFHIDSESHPDTTWNQAENYYPGDEWIDWIGVSIYGAYTPKSSYLNIFQIRMDEIYKHISEFAPDKPVIIAEFGTARDNLLLDQVKWTRDALSILNTEQYPNLIGFSWWNEWWQNDANPANDTTMRVQDNPELAKLFQNLVGNNPNVLGVIKQ